MMVGDDGRVEASAKGDGAERFECGGKCARAGWRELESVAEGARQSCVGRRAAECALRGLCVGYQVAGL